MAKKKWIALPSGRIKRWKQSESERGCKFVKQVPPHWFRNHLNRKERRRNGKALIKGKAHRFPHVHQHNGKLVLVNK